MGRPLSGKVGSDIGEKRLLQFRVLRLGFFQDGNVGVGVFPESEEVLVCGARFRGITLQCVGTRQAKAGQGSKRRVAHETTVCNEFTELGGGCASIVLKKVCLSSGVAREKTSDTPQLSWRGWLQGRDCGSSIAALQLDCASNGRLVVRVRISGISVIPTSMVRPACRSLSQMEMWSSQNTSIKIGNRKRTSHGSQ